VQIKRDLVSETKYIELVLVADYQEVCVCVLVHLYTNLLVK